MRQYPASKDGSYPHEFLREAIYEVVRLREFQHFVSRMECAYVFEEVIHAVEHAATGKGLVYEVEFVDPAAKQSQHCMNLVKNAVPPHLLIPRMEENARAYWTSASIQKAEILTLSGLRVVRRVS